jgi:single-strand DNA-binding protein
MNSIQIIGRLTADPQTHDGTKPVTRFRLAVDRPGSTEADFVPVVCFEQLAGAVGKHLTKGRRVAVAGRLASSRWTTAAGETRSALEVVAVSVTFLDRPGTRAAAGAGEDLPDGERHMTPVG